MLGSIVLHKTIFSRLLIMRWVGLMSSPVCAADSELSEASSARFTTSLTSS